MEIIKFDDSVLTDENVEKALSLHEHLAGELSAYKNIENILKSEHPHKSQLIKIQQKVQSFLVGYFDARKSLSKNAVYTATELLQRRKLKLNRVDENGEKIKLEYVDIGLQFMHKHFNNGELFPLSTFFTMVAGSGVGKSDYLYKMADSFLMQGYKTLICSFEFGEDRLSRLLDSKENGGKDRMQKSREAGLFDNLFINYYSRDLESLRLMVNIAINNGVRCILIDSFGEIERDKKTEYALQQEMAMMLNSMVNDYGIFIALISQTNAGEEENQYTMRGGEDFKYKPDISIHISKLSPTDTSGRRKVHLFKNRESDVNGKTIITKYNFETREIEFDCNFEDYVVLDDGTEAKKYKYKKK